MRLPLIFILMTVVIDSMGIGLVLPVMPALIQDIGAGGLAEAAIWGGIMSSSFAAMQFLFSPLLGALSDRFGRRPILLGSLLIMSLDYIIMAVAGTIWVLWAGRLVGGVMAATHSTAMAYVADISSPEEKATRFGLIGAAFGIGFVLGPLLGGLLAELGTRAPFYAAAGLAAANMVFGYFVLPETVTDRMRRPLNWRRANPVGALAHVGKLPGVGALLIMYFLYQLAFYVYPSVWAYFSTARFGWDEGMIGLSLAGFGIAMAIVQGVLMGTILKRFGDRKTILYGVIFNFLAFFALATVTQGWVALILTPLTALGVVVTPALQGMMSRRAPDDSQGELQGVLTSITAISAILSPLAMTSIFFAFTNETAPIYLPGAPFLASMLLMVGCGIVFWRAPRATEVPETSAAKSVSD